VIAIILLVIIIIIVICGVIAGAILAFMIVNKVIKRHIHLLAQQAQASYAMVADLDDPSQVNRAQKIDNHPFGLENHPLVGDPIVPVYPSKKKGDDYDVV